MAVYRSAKGKTINMGTLATRNEKVRAVGNMSVNARGDMVDSNNNIIVPATKRVQNSYKNGSLEADDNFSTNPIPVQKTASQLVPDELSKVPTIQEEEPDLTPEEKELFEEVDSEVEKVIDKKGTK
jgi:hypothetical protein